MSRLLRGSLRGSGMLAGLALLASLPSVAAAERAEFFARASNGYAIRVVTAGGKVSLSAEGPEGSVTYRVPGRTRGDRLVANFGRRGVIDAEFKPSQRMRIETPPNRCEGKPRVKRWGAFVGAIRFKGERGFTQLRIGRAAGRIEAFPRWRCKHRRSGAAARRSEVGEEKNEAPVIWEMSDSRRNLEVSAFSAGSADDLGLTFFFAILRERRQRMQIVRSAFEISEKDEFTYDESLSNAIIAPPFPFAGRGVFERRPGGSVSWAGSLSLVLPGTKRFSLVGPRFHPRLYRLGKDGIARPGA
jgi:hypothetical protein